MSRKTFLKALAIAQAGDLAGAIEALREVEIGFVRRRLRHYKEQPVHRETAHLLEEAVEASRSRFTAAVAVPETSFRAPLPPSSAE
jgi:hypothetical protein